MSEAHEPAFFLQHISEIYLDFVHCPRRLFFFSRWIALVCEGNNTGILNTTQKHPRTIPMTFIVT